jgi:uncharacterized protein
MPAANTCDICDKPMPGPMLEWPDYPFCSSRCRKIDLGRWLGEKYTIQDKNEQNDSSSPEIDEE